MVARSSGERRVFRSSGAYTATFGSAARRGPGFHTMSTRNTKTVTVTVAVDLHRCLWPLVWLAALLFS
jgi:hypothetical protein